MTSISYKSIKGKTDIILQLNINHVLSIDLLWHYVVAAFGKPLMRQTQDSVTQQAAGYWDVCHLPCFAGSTRK